MWPIRLVVVVLPFDPVMPMVGPCRNGAGQFDFADHRTPRAARLRAAEVGRHIGREHDQVAAFEHLGRSAARTGRRALETSRACGSWSSGLRSVARTSAPCSRSRNSTAAMPDFFIPTTSVLSPLQFHRYLSFNVVSANSASTRPAIQNRAMIFDSVQPSASK